MSSDHQSTDPASSENGGKLLVALIAASAAVLGALAGGGATYLGNKSLQENQSRSVAVGDARVLQARLNQADARFAFMLKHGLLLAPDSSVEPLVPSTQDEEAIATNLSFGDWSIVATGLGVYSLFVESATLGERQAQEVARGAEVRLDQATRARITEDDATLKAAVKALYPLTVGS